MEKLIDKFKNIFCSSTNINSSKKITTENRIIYSKLIDIEKCDTECRQKIIKKLIKNSDLDLSDALQNEILDCSSEIDECEFENGSKRLKVIVLLDDGYIYTLGYIPKNLEQELYEALNKSDKYTTDLYVTKINKVFYLKIELIYTKEYQTN